MQLNCQDLLQLQGNRRRADTPQPSFLRRLLNVWLRPPGAPANLRPRSPSPPKHDTRPVIKRPTAPPTNSKSRRDTSRSISFNERGAAVQLLQQKRNWTNGSQTLPHRPKPTVATPTACVIKAHALQCHLSRPLSVSAVIASSSGGATCTSAASCCCCPGNNPTTVTGSATTRNKRSSHVLPSKTAANMMPARSTPNLLPITNNVGAHQQPGQRYHRVSKKPAAHSPPNNNQQMLRHHQLQQQQQQQQQQLYNQYLGHVHQKSIPPPLPPTLSSSANLGNGGGSARRGDDESPPPTPPVRDSSSLKSVKYGPGHEKFPSWPVPATADTPAALRTPPGGGSHRSKSWTDHTNYPKEQPLTYTRPYMKRQHSSQTQQKLKTVLEKCEKIPSDVYDSKSSAHRYHNLVSTDIPAAHQPPTMIAERGPKYEQPTKQRTDRDGKVPADLHYTVPFPSERDLNNAAVASKAPGQTHPANNAYDKQSSTIKCASPPPMSALSPPIPPKMPHHPHTYNQQEQPYSNSISADSNYEDTYASYNSNQQVNDVDTLRSGEVDVVNSLLLLSALNHHKQVSYAQSEGYHSYVSSTDSTGTPFLDRLRRDSEAAPTAAQTHRSSDFGRTAMTSRSGGRDSVVTTSSGSVSSSETLKWHGSMSDVSSIAGSFTTSSTSPLHHPARSQHNIAHSARVKTPQRHHSESVLYIQQSGEQQWKEREIMNNGRNNRELKLFAVNTYTVEERDVERERREMVQQVVTASAVSSDASPTTTNSAATVADRVNEFEKQQRYSYLDPDKRHKVPDPTLKAIQKKALLSFYERRHAASTKPHKTTNTQSSVMVTNGNSSNWRSEPLLNGGATLSAVATFTVPKLPARKLVQLPSRRASSASDYSKRSSLASVNTSKESGYHQPVTSPKHSPPSSSKHQPKSPSKRSSLSDNLPSSGTKLTIKHQHSNSCGSLSTDLLGPVILGPSISLDDWVPEQPPARPPKNPALRNAYGLHESEDRSSHDSQLQAVTDLASKSPKNASNRRQKSSSSPLSSEDDADLVLPPPPPISDLVDSDLPLPPPPSDLIESSEMVYSAANELSCGAVAQGQVENSGGRKADSKTAANNDYSSSCAFINQTIGLPEPPQTDSSTTPVRESPCNFTSSSNIRQRYSPPSQKPAILNVTAYLTSDVLQKQLINKSDSLMTVRQNAMQRASIAITTGLDCSSGAQAPPPLQPRQMRTNQSMRARVCSDQKVVPGRASPKSKRSPTKESSKGLSNGTAGPQGNYAIMTPSKASYLASRRDRERIVPDSDTGVYKRTISPSGHVINNNNDCSTTATKMINTRETHWPNPKPATTVNHKNHVNILRRVSMNNKGDSIETNDELKQPQLALPDVLPVNAKLLGPRLMSRPSQLSLVPSENDLLQLSPATTPPSSPPKQSLFTPLRNTSLSTRTLSFIDKTPQIRPPLSPSSPKKLSPITRLSPNVPVKVMPSTKSLTPPDSPAMTISAASKASEGLQLIQRTEVVLRVNATTTDAASQTEKVDGDLLGVSSSTAASTPVPSRKKLKEEIECEQLSQEFVDGLLMPNACDRLKGLLVPGPEHKKSTDYVSGLYRVDVTLRPRPANSPFRSKATTPSNSPPPNSATCTGTSTTTSATQVTMHHCSNVTSNSESSSGVPPSPSLESIHSPLSASSAYFTTSEPKAKLLTRYSHDLNNQYNVIKDTKDLCQKKEELVTRLDRKLSVLRCEHILLQEESRINDLLGEEVRAHVCTVARPHEAAKVRLHVDEVGRITSLLLGLSGRLARAENALMRLDKDDEEKVMLVSKRDKLREQLEEAKQLKSCIDKRAVSVSNILYKYLTADEYADYDHYINMKAKLIMDAKEIVDNIQLGEEQLLALQETLIVPE